jgi:hypothetical protein
MNAHRIVKVSQRSDCVPFTNLVLPHISNGEYERRALSCAGPLHVEQSRAEQSRAEQSRAEQSRAEQSRAEQSRAEQSRAEQSRAEQSRAEQSRAEQSRAEQSRAEQSRAEQSIGNMRTRISTDATLRLVRNGVYQVTHNGRMLAFTLVTTKRHPPRESHRAPKAHQPPQHRR